MTLPLYRDLITQLTPAPTTKTQPTDHSVGGTEQLEGIASETTGPSSATDPEDLESRPGQSSSKPTMQAPPFPRPEALSITREEQELLAEIGPIIPTPRATKRLVNVYRMLRVSVPENELDAFAPDGGKECEAVVVLLGILVGRPASANEVFNAIMAGSDKKDVRDVLRCFPTVYQSLAGFLKPLTATDIGIYQRWAPRFSAPPSAWPAACYRTAGIIFTSRRALEDETHQLPP